MINTIEIVTTPKQADDLIKRLKSIRQTEQAKSFKRIDLLAPDYFGISFPKF